MVQPQVQPDLQIHDSENCAVIVAHPDDETLWVGGTILLHPDADWTIITICRKSDPDRSEKFYKAVDCLNAKGGMGNLDDGPEQSPLVIKEVKETILSLLPAYRYDLVITHSLWGEYTRHKRHEETAKAVLGLLEGGELIAKRVWIFAYEDGEGKYLPQADKNADKITELPDEIWRKKYDIITKIYGFGPESFEAKTTPKEEAFWFLRSKKNK